MNWKLKNPKFLLTLPPMQFTKDELIRPDGCLAVAYLDASLTKAGFYSEILDMNVGDKNDSLKDTFFNPIPISPKFVRIGMSQDRILKKVSNFDVIGISSVFTQQTSRCFEISNLIKSNFPEKIIIGGGVNSRNLKNHFFKNNFDVIFNSEAEKSLVDFAKYLDCGSPSLPKIEGISYMAINFLTLFVFLFLILFPFFVIISNLWEKIKRNYYSLLALISKASIK